MSSLKHHHLQSDILKPYRTINTLSAVNEEVIVNGEHNHISNPNNANKIRALLLAAIRSAVLWRQCGGTRWQLLLNRKAVLHAAQKLVDEHSSRVLH